jgi:hypothetical protein
MRDLMEYRKHELTTRGRVLRTAIRTALVTAGVATTITLVEPEFFLQFTFDSRKPTPADTVRVTEIIRARDTRDIDRSTDIETWPAFPGAEGYGANATWGIKPRVYSTAGFAAAVPNDSVCDRTNAVVHHVTNLDNSGSGSLRDIIDNDLADSRLDIIVFDTAGSIAASATILSIDNDCVYIAGQSAQGGIQIRGLRAFRSAASHIVVRYIRSRLGNIASALDAFRIYAVGGGLQSDIIFDHVSAAFAPDEGMIVRAQQDVLPGTDSLHATTVQYSLVCCTFTSHPTAFQYGGADTTRTGRHSMHHNLIANAGWRTPKAATNQLRAVSNVIAGFSSKAAITSEEGNDGTMELESNYFKHTSVTSNLDHLMRFHTSAQDGPYKVYIENNKLVDEDGVTIKEPGDDDWAYVEDQNNASVDSVGNRAYTRYTDDNPPAIPITVHTADQAYAALVTSGDAGAHQYVDCNGAWQDSRDALDTQVLLDVQNGELNGASPSDYPSSEGGYGGFPSIEVNASCADADGDGMPDAWEDAKGLDKNDASDANLDGDGDGYINIEEYLNGTNP